MTRTRGGRRGGLGRGSTSAISGTRTNRGSCPSSERVTGGHHGKSGQAGKPCNEASEGKLVDRRTWFFKGLLAQGICHQGGFGQIGFLAVYPLFLRPNRPAWAFVIHGLFHFLFPHAEVQAPLHAFEVPFAGSRKLAGIDGAIH